MGRNHCAAFHRIVQMVGTLFITGDSAADDLLNNDGIALLIGMLLDQQVPMEWAFAGPATLRQRLGHLDPEKVAAMSEDDLVGVCCVRPAIHRFPAAMGKRIHALCASIAAGYPSGVDRLWLDAEDGSDLYRRLRTLPGFGDEKAKIFIAVLGKRQGVQPAGWREAAGAFGDDVPRSVADIHSPESLQVVREWKKAQKAANKDKQDRPLRS